MCVYRNQIGPFVQATFTAPAKRVNLLIQTQDANPQIIKGEIKRYHGLVNTTQRVISEQGFFALWRDNVARR